jgi:hypothetical protein
MHRLLRVSVAAGLLGFAADAFGQAEPRRPEDVRRPLERAPEGRMLERAEQIKRQIEELRRELERLHEPPRRPERPPARPDEGGRRFEEAFRGWEELKRRAQEVGREAVENALRELERLRDGGPERPPARRPEEGREGAGRPGPLIQRFFMEKREEGRGHPMMPRLLEAPLRAPLPAPRADDRRPPEREIRPPARDDRLDDLRRMVGEARRLLDRIERELSELSRPAPGGPPRGQGFAPPGEFFRRGEGPGRPVFRQR